MPVALLSVRWVLCWVDVVVRGWVLVLFGVVEDSWLGEVWEVALGGLDCQNRTPVVEMDWRGGEFSSQALGFFPWHTDVRFISHQESDSNIPFLLRAGCHSPSWQHSEASIRS